VKVFILAPARLDRFQVRVLDSLAQDPRIELVGACIDTRPERTKVSKLRRDLRKGRGGYVVVKAVNALLHRTWLPVQTAAELFESEGVPFLPTDDLYGEETLDYIRSRSPDCLVRGGFGIIREPILSLAPKGVLSYHHGNIRRYRGTPVGFWELLHGERELSVTVQRLVPALDAGPIVRELTVPIFPGDSWRSVEKRAYAVSDRLLLEACLLVERDDFTPERVPEEELGALYTEPNLRQWSSLQARVGARKLRRVLRGESSSTGQEQLPRSS